MNLITAPAGWGYRPGYPLAGLGPDHLPDLPMLRMLRGEQKNAAIRDAIRSVPGLCHAVRVRDVQHKYSLPAVTASTILERARTAA